jgi:anti-sigma factor ChrR (cupin superfamily)
MSHSAITWAKPEDLPVVELYPGVRKRTLHQDSTGFKMLVVEIDAGSRFLELDVHEPGPEEVFVLTGVFNDGVRDYPAGTFIHNPRGSSHVPQSSGGCTLLVIFPQG